MQKLHWVLLWVKQNKLTAFLVLLVSFFILKNYVFSQTSGFQDMIVPIGEMQGGSSNLAIDRAVSSEGITAEWADQVQVVSSPVAPNMQQNRMSITNSNMSILTTNVREAISSIKSRTEGVGGYVVNYNISSPIDAESGNITIRIPLVQREAMIEFLQTVGVRVVSERINSNDVTDQFTDIEARLSTLRRTKNIYENILVEAQDVDEILRVQQRILSVQDQIDGLTGMANKLQTESQTTLIGISLSTDELALPYAPDQPWRPNVVFKLAVRSMLETLQDIGSLLIWVGVYSVVWVPALVIFVVFKKRRKLKAQS